MCTNIKVLKNVTLLRKLFCALVKKCSDILSELVLCLTTHVALFFKFVAAPSFERKCSAPVVLSAITSRTKHFLKRDQGSLLIEEIFSVCVK